MQSEEPDWTKANPFQPEIPKGVKFTKYSDLVEEEVGFLIVGEAKNRFFRVTCTCGVTDNYAANAFPSVDTPQSCGNPKHWFVKYKE